MYRRSPARSGLTTRMTSCAEARNSVGPLHGMQHELAFCQVVVIVPQCNRPDLPALLSNRRYKCIPMYILHMGAAVNLTVLTA